MRSLFSTSSTAVQDAPVVSNSGGDSERLAELEGLYSAIDKSMAVIEFQPDGTILNANQNFLSCLGYSLNEIKGQHHQMFCSEDYRKSSAYSQFWNNLRSGQFQGGEFLRLGKGGREIWIQATYNPIMVDGKVVKVIKQASDITEAKNSSKRYAIATGSSKQQRPTMIY